MVKKKFRVIKKRIIINFDEQGENRVLEDWVIRNYGKRCPDYVKDCACCKAWKCYDYLVME